jgi:hypothetical protein
LWGRQKIGVHQVHLINKLSSVPTTSILFAPDAGNGRAVNEVPKLSTLDMSQSLAFGRKRVVVLGCPELQKDFLHHGAIYRARVLRQVPGLSRRAASQFGRYPIFEREPGID